MKKSLLIATVALGLTFNSNAQVFEQGSKFVNVGIGLISPYAYSGSSMGLPPISGSFEYGITDKIGVGAIVGFTTSSLSYFGYKANFSYIIVGGRGAYHFLEHDKIDLYAGLMLGYNISSTSYTDNAGNSYTPILGPGFGGSGVAFGIFGGVRYMFAKKVGGFAELGYSISWITIGATFKF